MSDLTPAGPRNVNNNPLTAIATPDDAFRVLWSEALEKCKKSMTDDSPQWKSLLERMDRCRNAEDVCLVLDEYIESFERFRGSNTTWGKLRNKCLKPAIEVLLLFNDAIAETADNFPNVPGGKAMFVVFGVLLQATKGVTAYCEALVVLFEELNFFLESLRPRLHTPSGLGPASKTIAIAILALLLDISAHTAKVLAKRPWLGRLALYGKALIKDATVQSALQRLRALTDLESRAMTSETYVNASETRAITQATQDVATETQDVALETHDDVSYMRAVTSETQAAVSQIWVVSAESAEATRKLLSELQVLNEGYIQAAAARGFIGRGVDKLIRGQKEVMAFLRAEREHREELEASRIFETLARVDRADIDAQSPDGCMKGTRIKVLRDLRAWSHERNAPPIYWLNGMAGTGKSAIARSFCHILRRDELLAGSFFCSRGNTVEQGDVQRIIPTIAASMAARRAPFRKCLLDVLHEEPFSLHWNLALQIERLLRQPLSALRQDTRRPVLVVDALDECFDYDATRDLLSRLVRVAADLPVKFFLTSRPEPHIRQKLEALDPSLGHVLRLHDIEKDIVKADISLYLAHGLRAMREPSFPPKWPQNEDIAALTRLSGKLFIYAFTALQYLRKDPIRRLPNLTGATVTAGRPLTQPLDDIYTLILSEALDSDQYETMEIDLTRRMIATIVTVREPLTVNSLGKLLGIPASHIRASLNRLYAVIYVPVRDDSGTLSTFHTSFNEFLTTPGRAPEHMREPTADSHGQLATACIATLRSDKLHFNVSRASSSYLPNTRQKFASIDDALRYACLNWAHHVAVAVLTGSFDQISALSRLFAGPKFLFWLEALSAMGLAEKAIGILEGGLNICQQTELADIIEAAIDFTNRFSPAFVKSAPHVYISALSLCRGTQSMIDQSCSSFFRALPSMSFFGTDEQDHLALSAAYSSDGTYVMIGTAGGIEVVYRESNEWRKSQHHDFARVDGQHLAFSKGGTHLACLFKGEIACFSLSESGFTTVNTPQLNVNKLSVKGTQSADMTCITLSKDGRHMAIGSEDNRVYNWDTHTGSLMWKSKANKALPFGTSESVCTVAFSSDGSLIASGSSTGRVLLWDVRTGVLAQRPFQAHLGPVSTIAFYSDGIRAVSGSEDCTICFWDISCNIISRFVAHTSAVNSVAFSPDGTSIVSGSSDRTMCIWLWKMGENMPKPETNQTLALRRFEVLQPVRAAVFSSDGTKIICTTCYGSVQIWQTNLTNPSLHRSPWAGFSLDDDGWIRGPDGELMLWLSEEHRRTLTHQQCNAVLYGGRLNIDWRNIAQGTEWARCYKDVREKRR